MLDPAASWLNAASISAMASATATILLAFFTWRLASETRKLAGETQQDITAQWRPVLIEDDPPAFFSMTDDGSGTIGVALVNCGRGPALNVELALSETSSPVGENVHRAKIGSLPPGALRTHHFAAVPVPDHPPTDDDILFAVALNLKYKDIAGALHTGRVFSSVSREIALAAQQEPGKQFPLESEQTRIQGASDPREMF